MEFNLRKILKALLFSTSEALSIKDVQAVIRRYHEEMDKQEDRPETPHNEEHEQGVMNELMAQVPSLLTATQIRDAMEEIARELEDTDAVVRLVQGPAGYRVATAPAYADWVRLLRDEPRPARLSAAAMETLAIVAYRQPVTRAEMESIRGVSVEAGLNRLLEHELVCVTGRADLPGRPIQFGTTEKFLEYCGIQSLDELPASDVLSPNQIDTWLQEGQEQEEIDDQAMGLPTTEADEQAAQDPPEADSQTAESEPASGVSGSLSDSPDALDPATATHAETARQED